MQKAVGTSLATSDETLWWVVDQLPFPPRNGITLPSYNHALKLSRLARLRVVLLFSDAQPPTQELLTKNEAIFGPIQLVPLRRRGLMQRLVGELSGREMYQHGYVPAPGALVGPFRPDDRVVVTPMSAVAKLRACVSGGGWRAKLKLAIVNDCTAGEYRHRLQSCGAGPRARLKGSLDLLRSPHIGRIERAMLSEYDHVVLQTPRDVDLFRSLVRTGGATHLHSIPNGVNSDLFEVAASQAKRFLFLAELSGEHGALANWLISEVWPRVGPSDWELLIVGRGASKSLKDRLENTTSVRHLEFVEDISSIYGEASIALSPVFKGFGLINKTIEPMAAGIPVVGGRAAFNGIDGFINNVHGVCCDVAKPGLYAEAMRALMSDASLRSRMGAAGRTLVRSQFDWSKSSTKLERLLEINSPTSGDKLAGVR